ncbi:hypothetical protein B5X24_HaOG208894 [Helicoverpa armigera]|nr:hypothetical protein B5X24_HaOG208894 [Helicoverpa armigera]
MQKKILCLVLTLTILCLAESSPVNQRSVSAFDNFDGDGDALEQLYEVSTESSKKKDPAKSGVKYLGFVKKNIVDLGHHGKHNQGDLEQIFKKAKLRDHGKFDNVDAYALAEAIAATASADKARATRTYRKGKKTRGFHRVQHKDEYKKDQEFFEDDEVNKTINKVAAKGQGAKVSAGAKINRGVFEDEREKDFLAQQGFLDDGFVDREDQVFYNSLGVEDGSQSFEDSGSNEG